MLIQSKSVITQRVEGETILQNTETGTIHLLNATSGAIWDMCDGKHSKTDIKTIFIHKYPDVSPAEIISDVDSILQQFEDATLIIN